MSDTNDKDPGPSAPPEQGLVSTTRRRALLKGMSKGAALAGAAMPLRSLATGDKPGMRLPKDGKVYLCSVSGNASILHSAVSLNTTCSGKSCAYYKSDTSGKRPTWPKDATNQPICIVGSVTHSPSKTFFQVFGGGSQKSIGWLVDQAGDEGHWVTAMLNATIMTPSFPYSTAEVLNLYQGASQAAALVFFKSYLTQG